MCWVALPNAGLGDAQATAEYVAYNIKSLAAKSKTGKIGLVSHSQGGLNVQVSRVFLFAELFSCSG